MLLRQRAAGQFDAGLEAFGIRFEPKQR